jgi:tripartite-type tricarboxylate transporter receptor subunit TctC
MPRPSAFRSGVDPHRQAQGEHNMKNVGRAAAAACVYIISATTALADFPERPVQMIVPWGPGGGSDIQMRVVANYAEKYLGQPIPIINMPGVSGTLGLADAREREPDGYTIAQVHEGLLVAYHTDMTDVHIRDFEPIASFTSSPQFLVVNAASEWETFEEFVSYAEENPGALRVGVTLAGTPHLHAAMIEEAAGIEFSYVGHEGTGERVRALVGGHIDAIIGDVSSVQEFVENGDLRYLVAGSTERHPAASEIPTLAELGYDIELSNNRGVYAPVGTPEERLDTLEAAFSNLADDDEFIAAIEATGADMVYRGREEYRDYMDRLDEVVERLATQLVQ